MNNFNEHIWQIFTINSSEKPILAYIELSQQRIQSCTCCEIWSLLLKICLWSPRTVVLVFLIPGFDGLFLQQWSESRNKTVFCNRLFKLPPRLVLFHQKITTIQRFPAEDHLRYSAALAGKDKRWKKCQFSLFLHCQVPRPWAAAKPTGCYAVLAYRWDILQSAWSDLCKERCGGIYTFLQRMWAWCTSAHPPQEARLLDGGEGKPRQPWTVLQCSI